MINENPRAGEFLRAEANGTLSRTLIIVASGQNLAAGTVLGKITGGNYAAYDNTEDDGTQTAVGILYEAVDATAAATPGVMIDMHAEVCEAALTGIDAAGKTDLAALGFKFR